MHSYYPYFSPPEKLLKERGCVMEAVVMEPPEIWLPMVERGIFLGL
jgi:hypothetical protein